MVQRLGSPTEFCILFGSLGGSRDLLDASTSFDFPFRQFLSPTTLTTQHAATVGDHDGTRGPERRRGGAGGCTGRVYKVRSLCILIFSTKLTVPPFPQPQPPENAPTRHPWPPTAQPHMSQTLERAFPLPPPLHSPLPCPQHLLPPLPPSTTPDTKNTTTGSRSWCLGCPSPSYHPPPSTTPPPPTTQTPRTRPQGRVLGVWGVPSAFYHPDTKNATTGSRSLCLGTALALLPPRHEECDPVVPFFVSGDSPPPPTTPPPSTTQTALPLLPPRHQECDHRVAFFVSGECPRPPTTQT